MYSTLNYNRDNFNRLMREKITRKLIVATTIIVGLSILDKTL